MTTRPQSIPSAQPKATKEITAQKRVGSVPWAKQCALTKCGSPSSKNLFMVLASFVNGPDAAAWPSQATLSDMTELSARGIYNATSKLKASGHLKVSRRGKGRSLQYWLRPALTSDQDRHSLPIGSALTSDEVLREGTREVRTAAVTDIQTYRKPLKAKEEPPKAKSTKPKRHHCKVCPNSWPEFDKDGTPYGNECHQCQKAKPTARRITPVEQNDMRNSYVDRWKSSQELLAAMWARHHETC